MDPDPEGQIWPLGFFLHWWKVSGEKTNVLCWKNIRTFSFFPNFIIYVYYKTWFWKFKYRCRIWVFLCFSSLNWLFGFRYPEYKAPDTLNHCTNQTFSTVWGLVSRNSYEIGPKLEYVLRFPGRKRLWLTPAGILKQDFERWPSKVSSSLFLKWLEFNSQTSCCLVNWGKGHQLALTSLDLCSS